MIVLGISCYYHDSAACLVVNGRVVAAAMEERFSRKKHDNGFPKEAVAYCLRWAGLRIADVDAVVFYEKPILKFERILGQHLDSFPKSSKIFRENIGSWFGYKLRIRETIKKTLGHKGKVLFCRHHLAHAACAYHLSGFRKAAILTVDGVGEWATTTIGYGSGRDVHIDHEIRFPHSLGLLYSAITSYLGFEVNDAEYKVMGYAAYGNPDTYAEAFGKLIRFHDDGSFALTMEYFDYVWSDRMYSKKLEALFGMPTRPPESGIEQKYADVAAGLQKTLETAVFRLANEAARRYKTNNLCVSGGVALNSVLNGKLLAQTPFSRLYIPPDPGDGGGALGAALWAANDAGDHIDREGFFPDLGPSYSRRQVRDAVRMYGLSYQSIPDEAAMSKKVAKLLADEKVIGWFQGRMEWGPRALGFRSILASARRAEMKDVINSKIKHRELFRPFAPVILDRYVKSYFRTDKELSESAKFMLMVYPFTNKGKKEAPATVHVDGSGRLQVILREDNTAYYDLIEEYRKITGSPIILNTSFNVRGEPIVCTPRDAIECFLKTDIDYLVLEDIIVRK